MGTKILGVIAFVGIAAAAGWNYLQITNVWMDMYHIW